MWTTSEIDKMGLEVSSSIFPSETRNLKLWQCISFASKFPPTRLTPWPRPHHSPGNVFFKINGRRERSFGRGWGIKPHHFVVHTKTLKL